MARDVKIGIVITAKNAASAALKGVGTAAGAASKAVSAMAGSGSKAFSGLLKGAVGINQALEIGKKMWRLFDSAILGTVRAALEFRGANDAAAKQFKAFGRDIDLVRARLGDALIPILQGFAKVLRPILQGWLKWIEANRELIATNILGWLMKVGTVLIDVVAGGALVAANAWSGWLMVIDLVKLASTKFFSSVLDGSASLLATLGQVAEAWGMDGAGDKAYALGASVRALASDFNAYGDEAASSMQKLGEELQKRKDSILSIRHAAQVTFGKAIVAAQSAAARSTAGGTQKIEEQTAAVERLAARNALMAKLQKQIDDGLTEQTKANMEIRTEATNRAAEGQERLKAGAVAVGQEFGTMFAGIATGQLELEAGFKQMSLSMADSAIAAAEPVIIAEAAKAASGAASSQAGIPIVGPVLATVAAATMFAFVRGFLGKLQKKQMGGEITGGVANRDSVPALLMRGERVLTKEQNRKHNMGGGGGGAVYLTVNSRSFAPMSQAEVTKHVLGGKKALERLSRNRVLRLDGRR